ncbi:hypothetical protein F5Y08DRAFT_307706 [Xylaria arbuscula]|nr:hypothetical protein F5Y08DRAFT_307706 [Xylaria arbuscula]
MRGGTLCCFLDFLVWLLPWLAWLGLEATWRRGRLEQGLRKGNFCGNTGRGMQAYGQSSTSQGHNIMLEQAEAKPRQCPQVRTVLIFCWMGMPVL